MKKKIVTVILALSIAFSLVACSSSQVGEESTAIGQDVVQTIDNYLDGYINADTAYSTINKDLERMDDIEDKDASELNLSTQLLSVEIELGNMTWDGSGNINKIEDCRNEIANLVGEKKR